MFSDSRLYTRIPFALAVGVCQFEQLQSMYVVYVYAGGRQYSFHCYSLVNKPRFVPEFGVRWDGIVDGFKLSDEEYRLAVEKEQRRIKKKEKRELKKQKRFSNWMQKYVERNSIMSEDFYKNLERFVGKNIAMNGWI